MRSDRGKNATVSSITEVRIQHSEDTAYGAIACDAGVRR